MCVWEEVFHAVAQAPKQTLQGAVTRSEPRLRIIGFTRPADEQQTFGQLGGTGVCRNGIMVAGSSTLA